MRVCCLTESLIEEVGRVSSTLRPLCVEKSFYPYHSTYRPIWNDGMTLLHASTYRCILRSTNGPVECRASLMTGTEHLVLMGMPGMRLRPFPLHEPHEGREDGELKCLLWHDKVMETPRWAFFSLVDEDALICDNWQDSTGVVPTRRV